MLSPDEVKEMYITGPRAKIYGMDSSELRDKVREFCRSLNPSSMLEFGSSMGMNIEKVVGKDKKHLGIDINPKAVQKGKDSGLNIILGDEEELYKVEEQYDLVLTSSVLCHIKDTDKIMEKLKDIAAKYVVCLETNDELDIDLFAHDYSFMKPQWQYLSSKPQGNGCLYTLYLWEKE